jgi:hypothetical protein
VGAFIGKIPIKIVKLIHKPLTANGFMNSLKDWATNGQHEKSTKSKRIANKNNKSILN